MKNIIAAIILATISTPVFAICNTGNQTITFPMKKWRCVMNCNAQGLITGGYCNHGVNGISKDIEGGQVWDSLTSGLLTPIRKGNFILGGRTITILGIKAGSNNSAGGGWILVDGPYGLNQAGLTYEPR